MQPEGYRLIIFNILLFIYIFAVFEFLDTLLENRRIKKTMMLCVSVINTIIFSYLITFKDRNTTGIYVMIILCLFLEILILYKEPILRIIFVTLAVTIHIMTIRAIVMSIFALIYRLDLNQTNSGIYAIDSLLVSLSILTIITFLIKKYIPARAVKIITQHKEQLIFMTTWLMFANLYFLFNSTIFTGIEVIIFAKYNIIAVSVTIFFALYSVLIFTIKVGKLLNYKEKSDLLEGIVEDEKRYKNSVIDQAIISFEVNLTEDIIIDGFGEEYEYLDKKSDSYSELITSTLPPRVHPEDVEKVMKFMSVEYLKECFEKGEVDQSIEYRGLPYNSKDHAWVKIIFNLYKSSVTNSIMAFCYVKDINMEKQLELEMKNRSERDMLTGLYNHIMTKQLVNEFVEKQNNPPFKGTLLIIDVDNFKQINDNFGHGFGDDVLRDISVKLMSIFRCDKNTYSLRDKDDIIGRIGGDEFMVFTKNLDQEGVKERCQNICNLIKQTYTTVEGKEITISASVGITFVKDKEDTFKNLYAQADIALYNMKREGKNGYAFYNGESFQGYNGNR